MSITASAQDSLNVYSPDETLRMTIFKTDSTIAYEVYRNDKQIVKRENSRLGLTITGSVVLGDTGTTWHTTSEKEVRSVIESNLAERSVQPDNYNAATLQMSTGETGFDISIRVYNEGFAFKYDVKSAKSVGLTTDLSSINLSGQNLTFYTESGSERGYTDRKLSAGSGKSIMPLFARSDSLAITVNTAGNAGTASSGEVMIANDVVTFSQTISSAAGGFSTPWRYVVCAPTPLQMIEGKYIIRSLNDECEKEADWIKPGKVFRCTMLEYTDSVMDAINFARRQNYQYVLLDAGWYGMGYSYEHNKASNPFMPVATLDMQTVVQHANDNKIGIILYVNKVAWDNYSNQDMIDTYSSWGISGIKMGYMDALSQSGLRGIYRNVQRAFDKKMFVNVHDNMRPTGVERTWPNLLTTEGIRGNEHTDNTTTHTMMLPFTRFMTGPADYTFCFLGYPYDATGKVAKMVQTKGHQMAISVIYFSPLQHLLWYGKPWQYATRTYEIDFFKQLETVWDDYQLIEGEPGEYFSIARRKGNRWFVATATNKTERTTSLRLDFLDPSKTYTADIYEDDNARSVMHSMLDEVDASQSLTFSLLANGGAVAVLTETGNSVVTAEREKTADPMPRIVVMSDRIDISGTNILCVNVYNTQGQIVAHADANASNTYCSVPLRFPHGIYIVSVVCTDGTKNTKIRL